MSEHEPLRILQEEFPWGDGLPLSELREAVVLAMLEAAAVHGDTSIGRMPPSFAHVTAWDLAEVAAMAGCLPRYFPVVEASLRACLASPFNLLAIQTTTEPATPLVVVNGPIRRELPMNAGANVFGHGNRANATIGRAVRLALTKLGKAIPGMLDMATFGHPGKYTYCVAENEEQSPWLPFHAERGFSGDESVVTAIGADAPVNVKYGHTDAEGVLAMIAQTMAIPGSNNVLMGGEVVVVLSPQHAAILAKSGWSKADVRTYLFEKGCVAAARIPDRLRSIIQKKRGFTVSHDSLIPAADSAGAILLLVAGGIGGHSLVIPTFGETRAVSVRLREASH